MAEMEKAMAVMTQKLRNLALATVPMVPNLYPQPTGQNQRGMLNTTLTNSCKNCRGDWGHQFRGWLMKGMISIVFQNMGGIGNA